MAPAGQDALPGAEQAGQGVLVGGETDLEMCVTCTGDISTASPG